MLEVRAAAEHFHAVVRAVVHLDMIELGRRTDARRGQSLQFAVGRQVEARIADLDIAHPARIIVLDFAAIERVRRARSEEHTSELQSLMRISYAVFCLKKKNKTNRKYSLCSPKLRHI